MKAPITTTAASAALAFVLLAGTAGAQCQFDGPAKAKGVRSSFIRAHIGCPCPSMPCEAITPNSVTGSGVPSCAPPFAWSSYEFDDKKGACSLKASSKLESPCPGGGPGACGTLYVSAKCSGILDDGAPGLTNDTGFLLRLLIRATIDDPTNGDMTAIDFQVDSPFAAAKDGRLAFSGQPQPLLDAFVPGLPPCTQIEIVEAAIVDPENNEFAVLAAGTRPKGQ